MALIRCGECGSEISDKAPACIKCGAPLIKSATEVQLQNGRLNSGACEHCKRLLPAGCKECPDCGATFSGDSWQAPQAEKKATSPAFDRPNTLPIFETNGYAAKSSSTLWMWVIGIPLGLFLAFMLLGALAQKSDSQSDAKDKARELIKMCWKDQDRKSLTPGTQRYVASMCENFEEEFRQKFHASP